MYIVGQLPASYFFLIPLVECMAIYILETSNCTLKSTSKSAFFQNWYRVIILISSELTCVIISLTNWFLWECAHGFLGYVSLIDQLKFSTKYVLHELEVVMVTYNSGNMQNAILYTI